MFGLAFYNASGYQILSNFNLRKINTVYRGLNSCLWIWVHSRFINRLKRLNPRWFLFRRFLVFVKIRRFYLLFRNWMRARVCNCRFLNKRLIRIIRGCLRQWCESTFGLALLNACINLGVGKIFLTVPLIWLFFNRFRLIYILIGNGLIRRFRLSYKTMISKIYILIFIQF